MWPLPGALAQPRRHAARARILTLSISARRVRAGRTLDYRMRETRKSVLRVDLRWPLATAGLVALVAIPAILVCLRARSGSGLPAVSPDLPRKPQRAAL